jgi:hypothetical protein
MIPCFIQCTNSDDGSPFVFNPCDIVCYRPCERGQRCWIHLRGRSAEVCVDAPFEILKAGIEEALRKMEERTLRVTGAQLVRVVGAADGTPAEAAR